ncbi:glycosyltransferase family 2 protein [Glaciibacter superstes]|uniref:glycosyltransferase family 2 protein n=1 Tax=Glaciibacter superstes TaxID=501023 RepID=UPI0003B65BEB|nr:glycosyltransferase family 2 protein [Glaciibacter superstes]
MERSGSEDSPPYALSVVIPVYRGELTLRSVVEELLPLTVPTLTPAGAEFIVSEVIIVHDDGPDGSDAVILELSEAHPVVNVVWLSRNFGQHAATLAGMAESTGTWIVTMDEDGQHDPADIGKFLDVGLATRAGVVYANFTNERPHGFLRSIASRTAKRMLGAVFGTPDSSRFQSFRLVRGDMARQLTSFAAPGVYLDVALSWVTTNIATAPTELRSDAGRPSTYSLRALLAYFWRLVVTSGTRGLRLVSVAGALIALIGLVIAVYIVIAYASGNVPEPQGWPSLMVIVLLCSGAILIALGIIAEYLGAVQNVAMGRPLYVVVDPPGTAQPSALHLPAHAEGMRL